MRPLLLLLGLTLLGLTLQLLGCGAGTPPGFPEDQLIHRRLEIGTAWQTIEFSRPLLLNRKGLQHLHLVVDHTLYLPNSHYNIKDLPNQSNLRRNDGVLVKPEIILIGDNNEEFAPFAVSNTHLYAGGLTIGFGTYDGHYAPAPPWPEGIRAFKAMRIRSNEPFTVHYLEWRMDTPFPNQE